MTLRELNEKINVFLVALRDENTFDDELYSEIYSALSDFVNEWKTQGAIPNLGFLSCMYLIDFLAGGSRFLSEEVCEKVEDADNDIVELLTILDSDEHGRACWDKL